MQLHEHRIFCQGMSKVGNTVYHFTKREKTTAAAQKIPTLLIGKRKAQEEGNSNALEILKGNCKKRLALLYTLASFFHYVDLQWATYPKWLPKKKPQMQKWCYGLKTNNCWRLRRRKWTWILKKSCFLCKITITGMVAAIILFSNVYNIIRNC